MLNNVVRLTSRYYACWQHMIMNETSLNDEMICITTSCNKVLYSNIFGISVVKGSSHFHQVPVQQLEQISGIFPDFLISNPRTICVNRCRPALSELALPRGNFTSAIAPLPSRALNNHFAIDCRCNLALESFWRPFDGEGAGRTQVEARCLNGEPSCYTLLLGAFSLYVSLATTWESFQCLSPCLIIFPDVLQPPLEVISAFVSQQELFLAESMQG